MSKVDALRALREQNYARRSVPPIRRAESVTPVRSLTPVIPAAIDDPGVSALHSADPPAPAVVGGSAAPEADAATDGPSGDGCPVRCARPGITPGRPIASYTDEDLRALVAWINSDGVRRDEDALLDAVMKDLGFTRRGKNIRARVAAVAAA